MPNPERPLPNRWPARILVAAFLATAAYSVYLAAQLLRARCEGFSCTYLGMAWVFWLGVLGLPVTVLGYFAQKSPSVSRRLRVVLRVLWGAHTVFALGLLGWWLLPRG